MHVDVLGHTGCMAAGRGCKMAGERVGSWAGERGGSWAARVRGVREPGGGPSKMSRHMGMSRHMEMSRRFGMSRRMGMKHHCRRS